MKKILAIILTLVMVFSIVPLGAVTVSAATSGTTGDCTWSLDGTVLTISGNGEMGDCGYEVNPWGYDITEVIIENGVTSICEYAFSECERLTSITIPDSVKSIGNSAFFWCVKLKSVTIPDGIKSIGDSTFLYCFSLKSIKIPDNVTSIGDYAFSGCEKLTSVTIPDSVTSIGDEAFSDCSNLESITIPDSVTSIGFFAFSNTGYYNNLSNWEGDVLYIGSHFISAKSSTNGSYTIKPGTKTIAGGAFYNCESLTSVIIPNSVTSIGGSAFEECANLKSIKIPDSVTSIGYYAFSACKKLTSITIPDSVTSIGASAFIYCSNLKSITIPDSVTSIGEEAFYNTAYYKDGNNWKNKALYIGNHLIKVKKSVSKKYTIKKGTKSIAGEAFAYSNIEAMIIPDGITTIANNTFLSSSIKSIVIPKSVKVISTAFGNCSELKNVYYVGSKKDKEKIQLDDYVGKNDNSYFYSATWHYNVCIDNGKHSYKTKYNKATTNDNGKSYKQCKYCEHIKDEEKINKIKTVKLSTISYTYNGKAKSPKVTVKDSKGNVIKDKYYTVTGTGKKKVGEYTVKVKFKTKYSGTVKVKYVINPKKSSVSSVTAATKSLKVKIKKVSSQATGYEIQYSTSKKFTSSTTKTKKITSYKTTSATIKSLKAKKTYYVRVRTYKTVDGKKYYSDWSSSKSKKTK